VPTVRKHLAFEGARSARGPECGVRRQPRFESSVGGGGLSAQRSLLGHSPGDAAEMHRWRLARERWSQGRRDDIELVGVAGCLPVLGIS
jgi:hypothetical protein